MKKIYVLALCSALSLNFSCGSDDNGSGDEISGSLSVEEGKKQLEDNSLELLDKIDAFQNDNALNEIVELAEYVNTDNLTKLDDFKKTSLNTISNVSSIEASNNGLAVFNAKQALTLVSEMPLSDDYNEKKGIYLWNSQTEEFDKTGDSDDIIYNVEYNGGKKAVFSFTDFTTELVGGEEELPTLVKANLTIDNITVFSQEYTAAFQNDQLIPSQINNTTTIGGFSFVTSYTNSNNSSINQSFEFKLGADVIMGYNYTANGNFNNDDGDVEDILNDISLTLQFLEAKLTITANDNSFNSDASLSIDEQVALLNKNIMSELSVNNKSVAKSQFYKDEDTYTTYQYNATTQQWEEVEVTEDIVNVKFLFEDGTSSDFDTYIEGSFTELENKFETVFDAYEDLFKDIELD